MLIGLVLLANCLVISQRATAPGTVGDRASAAATEPGVTTTKGSSLAVAQEDLRPTQIAVPRIGIRTSVIGLGTAKDGTLEVPAGVLVAVERRFAEIGIPAVGLWARVPHYAAAMPYPEASLLLLDGLAKVSGVVVDRSALDDAAEATRQRLDDLTANSAEHSALVRQLEARSDAEADGGLAAGGWENLPTADELGAEVERFLEGEGA